MTETRPEMSLDTSLDTPLESSRIGLGLAAAGRPAYITSGRDEDLGQSRSVEEMRALCVTLLDTAYAHGVRYIDAARSYGLAEDFLAGWLTSRPDTPDVVVGSKWGYRYVGDWQLGASVHEVKDHSLAAFTEQLALSRELLGNHLAIYHVHSLTPESPALTDRGLHRALAELRASGVRVGFSTSGPAQADVVRQGAALTVDGLPLFSSVQSTWNLLEPSAGAALAEAAAAGMTVIVKEAVANGRLVDGRLVDGRLVHGTDDPGATAVSELADTLDARVDQIALAAALAQPWAWRVLSGAVTSEQLTQNLAAETLELSPSDIDAITSQAQPAEEYWAQRAARQWR